MKVFLYDKKNNTIITKTDIKTFSFYNGCYILACSRGGEAFSADSYYLISCENQPLNSEQDELTAWMNAQSHS